MSHWPIHEYDPRPAQRKFRRAWLVMLEHMTREMKLYEIVEWLNKKVSK